MFFLIKDKIESLIRSMLFFLSYILNAMNFSARLVLISGHGEASDESSVPKKIAATSLNDQKLPVSIQ